MNYFPRGSEEIELIKFIARYQYLREMDAKYFFDSKRYYRNRIKNLIDKQYLKKSKRNLVLDKNGIEYVKINQFEYNEANRNSKYIERLKRLSNIGAFYNKFENVEFIPSFSIKDKDIHTTRSRRYIGNEVYYSQYNFCDYTNDKNKYISTFYLYDVEKINRIRYFLRENSNKNIDIICNKQIYNQLIKELPNANYHIVNLENYIDKERNIYD